ncbi:MAG: Deoxyuridine 5'-triphosphate nucleotidohydrolase [Chroococcopsis gigantea SAG 12.99]|nr:dUTP diphosphatase [Chlorogloea purpurea SAG 13.99]MDV2998487.1 Deoxyuridine 5'-triphosphate nucleotidohydrolase [Chroococcopsis gigantea SAG 12.99]
MNNVVVKIKRLHPDTQIPRYEHYGDSGADLVSVISTVIAPREWRGIPTGIAAEVPPGYELQVRPRSGLALKQGITVLNTPGTIDAGYRGEIVVILLNLNSEPFSIVKGQKIAQLVVAPVIFGQFQEVEELTPSTRNQGGFGSTGTIYTGANNG